MDIDENLIVAIIATLIAGLSWLQGHKTKKEVVLERTERTSEVAALKQQAAAAELQAEATKQQAEAAKQHAEIAKQQAEAASQQVQAAKQQAEAALDSASQLAKLVEATARTADAQEGARLIESERNRISNEPRLKFHAAGTINNMGPGNKFTLMNVGHRLTDFHVIDDAGPEVTVRTLNISAESNETVEFEVVFNGTDTDKQILARAETALSGKMEYNDAMGNRYSRGFRLRNQVIELDDKHSLVA